MRYHRVPEMARKTEKLEFLTKGEVAWETLAPDAQSWIVPKNADEYAAFSALAELFDLWTLGVGTNRDSVVYDWDADKLRTRIMRVVAGYNTQVHRHKEDNDADWPTEIKWSEALKLNVKRGKLAKFEQNKIVLSLFRPFTKRWLFFDRILNERVYQWPKIAGQVIWVKTGTEWPFFVLASGIICDRLPQGGSQCFPLSHLKDAAVAQFRQHYADPSLTKEQVFLYLKRQRLGL